MKHLVAALQFMTLLPLGKPAAFKPSAMVPYFPLAGIIIGCLMAVFDQMVMRLWPAPVAALLDVVFLIALTGALHIDGVGDTADGLYGGHTNEKALSIMKDSRLGTMGMVAIFCILAIKWAGIYSLDTHRSLMLIVIPGYARGAMILGMRLLPYGRPDGGTGQPFVEGRGRWSDYIWLALPFGLAMVAGWRGIMVAVAFVFVTASVLYYYHKRVGCITGDMLGAICEINEAGLLLIGAIGMQA
jgi:adenosylcobinamide-GDP ribazoletransferase